mmetsp:Transcript_7633/g.21646  ORF Transcript_7633/g.21646 Transcript_7633/m.21646 type:complete len:86 (-) Transcript_7633:403-660(-)
MIQTPMHAAYQHLAHTAFARLYTEQPNQNGLQAESRTLKRSCIATEAVVLREQTRRANGSFQVAFVQKIETCCQPGAAEKESKQC